MFTRVERRAEKYYQRYTFVAVAALALTVFLITWVGITESRSDSFKLLVDQGSAFSEALAQAVDNAILSESFYDYLVQARYSEVVVEVNEQLAGKLSDSSLARIAHAHDLYGLFLFEADSALVAGASMHGGYGGTPEFVLSEVRQFFDNPASKSLLLLDEGESPGEATHFYLEISNDFSRIVLVIADAQYYQEALTQTQIGYLAMNLAKEKGIEYVIYQTAEGIVFASRKTGNLLAIESDPFLTAALEADSIMHREYELLDRKVLEMVRPFSTQEYPFGLLRVGLSLDRYYAISRSFDFQMISLSGVLLAFLLAVVLYLLTRRRRLDIARELGHIKSVTDKIFDEMKTGVAAVDGQGLIRLANDAFEKTMASPGPVGRSWNDIVGQTELSFEAITTGRETSTEKEIEIAAAGQKRSILVAVSRLSDWEGQGAGMVAAVYDMTHLRELESQTARKERLSEMGNLAAGVAHEIRNPLNSISIAAQRLATEFTPAENPQEYLSFTSQIRTETKRLNDIISRFLALSREESKKRVRFRLDTLINQVAEFLRPEAHKLAIDLYVQVTSGLEVEADADSLKEVFSNLFNNAKEALNGQPGRISITARSVEDGIEIRFADSGPGIPKKERGKVFTPYYTTKEAGTGLGLPAVHKAIIEQGGDIRIETSKWGGASFVITIPRK